MPQNPFEFVQAFQQHFGQFLPDLAATAKSDVEQHMRSAFLSMAEKMELVTREEFDAQAEVLRVTRQKLDALVLRVEALEAQQAQTADQSL